MTANFILSLASLALLLAKSTLIVCIAFGGSWLLRKHTGAARHGIWIATMALLIAIFAVAPYLHWRVAIPTSAAMIAGPEMPPRSAIAPPAHSTASRPAPVIVRVQPPSLMKRAARAVLAVNWTRKLLFVWWLGIAFVLVRQIVARVQLSRLSRRAREADAESTSHFEQIVRNAGIGRPVALLVSDEVDVPLTWGMFNARVLLPKSYTEWERGRLENVLQHELAHVRRLDAFTALLADAACALYWYNPLVWLASTQMRLEREIACDEAVLATGARPSDYATDLLDLAVNVRFGSLHRAGLAIAGCPRFEQRVRTILNGAPRTALSRIAVAATVLGAIAVMPLAAFQISEATQRVVYPIPRPEVMTFQTYATSGRIADVVKMATEDPSLINARAREGQTALGQALVSFSPRGHEVALWLIAHGADVNAASLGGSTVLMQAVRYPDILQMLLDRGADIHATNVFGRTALDEAIFSRGAWPSDPQRKLNIEKSMEALRAHGAKLSFLSAVRLPDADVVKQYLTEDPSLVHKTWFGSGPAALMQAMQARAGSGDPDKYKPVIDVISSFIQDPDLCEAAMLGRTDILAKDLGDKPSKAQDRIESYNYRPLECALLANERGSVLYLVNHGAKPDVMDLRFAVSDTDADTVRLLLSFGAAKGMSKGSLTTLAIWADQRNKKDVADLLRAAE